MALAHELWAVDLESKGISRTGAHVSVSITMVRDEYQEEALNDPVYTIFVEKALTEMNVTPDKKEVNANEDSY